MTWCWGMFFVGWTTLANAQPPRLSPSPSAAVENKQVVLRFPLPYANSKGSTPRLIGFYAWRVSVEAPVPFTFVLTADTAMRTNKTAEILEASSVRLCPSATPRSVLECTTPIAARVEVEQLGIRVTIRDTSLIARLHRERPLVYWQSIIEPGGRIQLRQMGWTYRDDRKR